jgi:hypothetical protein
MAPTTVRIAPAERPSLLGGVFGARRVKPGRHAPILERNALAGACAAAGECVSLDDELSDGLQSCEGT